MKGHDIRATAPRQGIWLGRGEQSREGDATSRDVFTATRGAGQKKEGLFRIKPGVETSLRLSFGGNVESSKHRVREAIYHLEVSLKGTVPRRGSRGGSQAQEGMQVGLSWGRSSWEAGLADKLEWSGISLTVVRVLTSCHAFGLCKKRMFPYSRQSLESSMAVRNEYLIMSMTP